MSSSSPPPSPQQQQPQQPTEVELPALAEGHVVDLIQHYSYMIVHGDLNAEYRLEHWESLQYFWYHVYPRHERSPYGRLANRVKLAELIILSSSQPQPYDYNYDAMVEEEEEEQHQEEEDGEHDNNNMIQKPMVAWNRKDWERLDHLLRLAQQSLLRLDAGRTVIGPDEERPQLHAKRAESPLYQKLLADVRAQILVNQALSPIRLALQRDMAQGEWDLPSIHQEQLEEVRSYIDSMDNAKAKKFLDSLILTDTTTGEIQVLSLNMKKTFQDIPLSLKLLQKQIVGLVEKWSNDIFSNGPPPLTRLYNADYQSLASIPIHRIVVASENQQHSHHQEGDENRRPILSLKRVKSNKVHHRRQEDRKETPQQVRKLRLASGELLDAADDPLGDSLEIANRAKKVSRQKSNNENQESLRHRYNEQEDDDPNDNQQHNNDHEEDDVEQTRQRNHSSSPRRRKKSSKSALATKQATSKTKSKQKLNISTSSDEEEEEEPGTPARRQRDRTSVSSSSKKRLAKEARDLWVDSEGEENLQSVHLSAVPTGPRAMVPQKKRRFFSAEEKQALREGLAVHGTGRWKDILDDYADVFEGRKPMNLKDLYRTMMRNGEI